MPDDLGEFEGLEGLEDREYELGVEEIEATALSEFVGPCGGCTECASGSPPVGADLENKEAALDVVEIRFKSSRSCFCVNNSGGEIKAGSMVILDAERGTDMGMVVSVGEAAHEKRRSRGLVGQPMRNVLRLAGEEDVRQLEENRQTEEKAVAIFNARSQKYHLDMKLALVEYQFDRSRITFYFTAEGRVDFRLLVRDLASVYRTRIELRQIGARDEARKIGALGICGREICCLGWMSQIKRVNLDHARFQNLSLNPQRLAGSCGRLKCCILFELESYADALRRFPPLTAKIVTSKGEGVIDKLDIFRDFIYIRYQNTDVVEAVNLADVKSFQNTYHVNQIHNH
ncbi:MAG TPA: regulatory iron-sulfur-containing complex subunit RicT [Candidatus Kryptonia bacterium]